MAAENACRVRFEPSGTQIDVARGTSVLAAARALDLPIANACGATGTCGKCGVRLLDGAERVTPPGRREVRVATANRVDPGARLACMTRVRGDCTVTADYW